MNDLVPVRVAVVMLTYNQRETTLRALRSLMPQIDGCDRVIVWDNGSTDGTIEAIRAKFPEVLAHPHPVNLGVASGRNAGAALARELFAPQYLLFLDNDLVLKPGFVAALGQTLDDEPGVGQVQAKLLFLNDPQRLNDGGGCRINFWLGSTSPVRFNEIDNGQCEQVRPCISCGGAMMVRADLFHALNGFDSIFDPFGPEDLDFSLRLKQSGHEAWFNPAAVALHEVSHTFEGGNYSSVYARSKASHWLKFLRRHGTPMQKLGFFAVGAPLIALRMIFRELARGNPGALTGSVRGILDAYRNSGRSDK
jgi:GT2 family glycosyltransferase